MSDAFSRSLERRLLKATREVARTARPNPSRVDCPDAGTLAAIAQHRPVDTQLGNLIDHIANCSPCFVEYERLRALHKATKVGKVLVFAMALGLAGYSLLALFQPNRPVVTKKPTPAPPSEPQRAQLAVIDLRFSAPLRGDQVPPPSDPRHKLPRGLLDLQVQLPLGSPEGAYDVELYASAQRRSNLVNGTARFRNQSEVLEVRIDTTALPSGTYELRIRPVGAAQQRYPVLIE